jgi:hypothetical protein
LALNSRHVADFEMYKLHKPPEGGSSASHSRTAPSKHTGKAKRHKPAAWTAQKPRFFWKKDWKKEKLLLPAGQQEGL